MNNAPRILIIERNPVAGQALKQTLNAQGYVALQVPNGEQAIALIEREQANPDLANIGVVITDQDAGGLSAGVGLIRRLHDDWPSVVPIMVSGFRKVESAVQAMRLGAADYLLKPIVESELLDAVQRAVQRHLLLVEHAVAQQDVADQTGDRCDNEPADAPPPPTAADDDSPWQPMPLAEAMKGPERRILRAALDANGWHRSQTAKQLDINRATLYKKIRQYRLDEPA